MPIAYADDAAIRDLYARAVQTFDRGDISWVDYWADEPEFFFPPDPATGFPGMTLNSREALTGMVQQAYGMMEGRGLHHFTNLTIDEIDEGARVRGYLLLVKSGTGPDNPSQVMQNTRIEDIVILTEAGWKFRRRSVGSIWG
ncbi:nuclear transport factor 2 family protein [Sphingobium algorifonticola]|uniref:SnoaL-like domain-containing protein n=1 Tax=Sphingobium algorifonticola TaxID=2008318 RepID=A0A437JA13_9SPHN|nr:nuclear transport factor 2 family protein [Sphingobium algorifonticola]RVT42338.1 hypothetical protein ENE74_09095 [Sphingobium algorifonticola]